MSKILKYNGNGKGPLFQQAKVITEWNQGLNDVAKSMIIYLLDHPEAAAIAANQWGREENFFVYMKSVMAPVVVINPVIVYGEHPVYVPEGCLSFPGVTAAIERFQTVEVVYTDLQTFEEMTVVLEDFEAQVFQHEIDHLRGLTMLDRMDEEAKNGFLARYWEAVRNNRSGKKPTGRTRT